MLIFLGVVSVVSKVFLLDFLPPQKKMFETTRCELNLDESHIVFHALGG